MLYGVEWNRYWNLPLTPGCCDGFRRCNDNPPAPPSDEGLIKEAMRVFRIVAQEFFFIPDEDEEEDGRTVYGLKTYMELFADQISKRMFGKTWPKALAYLTAHKLKMMGVTGTVTDENGNTTTVETDDGLGPMALAMRISSASEGETSVSFRSLATSGDGSSSVDGDYELTTYGIEFLKLRKNCIVGIISAGEPEYRNGRRL